ncbi:MAG: bifunctional hydroxymethylpyrimidine kinase/phosphomethylpyrimidine kinase [Rhodomicrobium sp.]|nr:bifunctional hydroxymethylpyrimidine kinase/phosphomethylpyrimidine kinase [Rhodomicrobium sp.]
MSATTPAALSIAGSDSSAGAGLQADLKTFSALGVYGATVVTAVTAQNTRQVTAVHPIPPGIISAQIDAVFSDLAVRAVKTGMLGTADGVEAVAAGLERWAGGMPLVVDPVMVSATGSRLLERDAEIALAKRLIPLAALITPNLQEAAVLINSGVAQNDGEAKDQAVRLLALGPRAVLLKGGHATGPDAIDLYFDGQEFRSHRAPRIATRNIHGTGCTLASAITAFLVKGLPMEEAIAQAKTYLHGAIERAGDLDIGAGAGPVSHFYRGVG